MSSPALPLPVGLNCHFEDYLLSLNRSQADSPGTQRPKHDAHSKLHPSCSRQGLLSRRPHFRIPDEELLPRATPQSMKTKDTEP